MSPEQAKLIYDAHEITSILESDEEIALMEANNPQLLDAYFALHRAAFGQGILDYQKFRMPGVEMDDNDYTPNDNSTWAPRS